MDFRLRDITKLPNILTIMRILLIPLILKCFFIGGEGGRASAAVLIVLSGITDALDGIIARCGGMITDLGKLLDPLADKLTQAAVAACLLAGFPELRELAAALLALIIVKETAQLVMGALWLRQGLTLGGAKWFGKLSTAAFYVIVIMLVGLPGVSLTDAAGLMLCAAAFSLMSFALYILAYFRLWQRQGA